MAAVLEEAEAAAPRPLPEGQLTAQQVNRVVDQFLVDNGALVRINDAARDHGIIVAQQNSTYDWTRAVPTLIMRNEDYGRITRILADGTPVTLRINIQNKEYPEGVTSYDAIGEIPGTDKKDEIVMLGGHYDSWHGATGATDNGIGSSMMLEAIRLLAALHVKPRRTIRVALWSGEEEGLLGSLAYVKQHFGSAEDPKPEFAKLDAYFNIDSGTGKPRGAGVFRATCRGRHDSPSLHALSRLGLHGCARIGEPPDRRHRQHFLQQCRTSWNRAKPGRV